MEADADVTVKSPQPFYPQQVFSIPGRHVTLLMAPVAEQPNVVKCLSPAAENSKRSKAAKQKDLVEEELHVDPCWSRNHPPGTYGGALVGGKVKIVVEKFPVECQEQKPIKAVQDWNLLELSQFIG